MSSFLAADFSDYSVLVFGSISIALVVAIARFLGRRAQRAAIDQFTEAVTAIVATIVTPQMEAMRGQNRHLQETLEDVLSQKNRDHAAIDRRIAAIEHRLPLLPPDVPPLPRFR